MIRHHASAALLAASLLLTGCGGGAAVPPDHQGPASSPAAPGTRTPDVVARTVPRQLPGLGPKTRAAVPASARQVVVVTGRGPNSPLSEVVLHRRTGTGWQPGPVWPAHNALRGWTHHHLAGDLRSPVGVYGLSDAGGRLPDPGTRLPYDRSPGGFRSPGTGFEGESLDGSFDHVIAIDYNREPGTSPLDWTRPLGAGRGGGIWIHVDHGGPTHGCVSIAERHMRELLLALDPALHPVVVMGDHASLAR
ncbi:L,D-transpeptidase family protein [Streptomyces sp. NPDC006622]|uniref:L,D-transpeptidase family protein n=1 Tax=Streptomyces sp. NPDC006622 TaxID=3155459 RepID=UPI0033BBA1EC